MRPILARLRVWLALAALAVLLIAALIRLVGLPTLIGPLNAGLVRIQQDFRPTAAFTLFDSLPALSPGLSNLEAFALTLPPGSFANADRSMWLAGRADTVTFAFHTERSRFDSATLYLWTGDVMHRTTLRRRGSHAWRIPLGRKVSGWSEIVGIYLSYPPLFRMRASDSSVAVFERVEGDVLHVVANAYAPREDMARPPDTAYVAAGPGELTLLARGSALAIVNSTREAVRLRLLPVPAGISTFHEVPAGTVHVYRGLLDRRVPALAYTGAGQPSCLLGRCRRMETEFFRLGP